MKKKLLLGLVCALLALMPMCALAERTANCGIKGHYRGDGMNHDRPESCWVKGHTLCDGGDHDFAPCKIFHHFNCDGRNHVPAACGVEGHYACDGKKHEPAACGVAGHCAVDGKSHMPAYCGTPGHYACDGLAHYTASCTTRGHKLCDGLDHARGACGKYNHFACDGLAHARAECGRSGHCVSDGLIHAPAPCGYAGHYLCDGRNHELAACGVEGHFACEARAHLHKPISKYCNAVPQHMVCEGDQMHYCDPAQGGCGDTYPCRRSNAHTACRMCGLLWCDQSLGGHETPCGNANHRPCVYTMNGKRYSIKAHEYCGYCGGYKCENNGEHGNGKCCSSCGHCGGPEKLGVSHKAECGVHYWCVTKGKHTDCPKCHYPLCSQKHREACAKPTPAPETSSDTKS